MGKAEEGDKKEEKDEKKLRDGHEKTEEKPEMDQVYMSATGKAAGNCTFSMAYAESWDFEEGPRTLRTPRLSASTSPSLRLLRRRPPMTLRRRRSDFDRFLRLNLLVEGSLKTPTALTSCLQICSKLCLQ